MPSYPLAALLAVRKHKEGLAQQAVIRAENTLLEARKELKRVEEECRSYEEWCQQEIDRYYSEIIGKSILFKELDLLKIKTNILLDNVKEKYKLVDKAKDYVEACIEEKEKAIARLAEARKQTAKLDMHREKWEAEVKEIMEKKEEVELEDFRTPDITSQDE